MQMRDVWTISNICPPFIIFDVTEIEKKYNKKTANPASMRVSKKMTTDGRLQ